jgi:hypothetical protein
MENNSSSELFVIEIIMAPATEAAAETADRDTSETVAQGHAQPRDAFDRVDSGAQAVTRESANRGKQSEGASSTTETSANGGDSHQKVARRASDNLDDYLADGCVLL